MVTVQSLIAELPPYSDQWEIIHPDQKVNDIIIEVCEAHEEFAPYYDLIGFYFDDVSEYKIAEKIYRFLKQNIKYKEESDKDQTTALPTGLLMRGQGDCKHYSGFSAGVLDSLNREGKKINWCYRFASYKLLEKTPHHVFVVINPGTENEIWIDPTPNAEKMSPVWQLDKKVGTMLRRNIAGLEYYDDWEDMPLSTVGITSINVHPAINVDNINFDGSGRYRGVFGNYMGLTDYRDYSGDRNINEAAVAAELNQAIAAGPSPNHVVTPDFVKWVYNESIRSWNFFYPGGVAPGFTADQYMVGGWPKLVMTDDYRLTFDHDVKVDDYRNAEIHLLTAWAQSLVNQYDSTPYPVKPRHLKEFSQNYTGNPGNPNANLFNEARGASFFKEVGKALENTLNDVKAGFLKVVGSIPRNCFLILVRFNIFNIAKKLVEKIDEGKWDQIADRWKSLGGNPDKLLGTINDGKHKPDPGITADSQETLGAMIGGEPVTATAIIAAAAPIIAAMLAFIPDREGKLHDVLQATKAAASKLFPNLDLDAYGFLDKNTGQRINFMVDDADNENLGGGNTDLPGGSGSPLDTIKKNPMIAAVGVGAALYLIPKKKNLLLSAAGAIATYFFLNNNRTTQSLPLSTDAMRQALVKWDVKNEAANVWPALTAAEVATVYDFIFNYFLKNISVPEGTLKNQLAVISNKYNIFT